MAGAASGGQLCSLPSACEGACRLCHMLVDHMKILETGPLTPKNVGTVLVRAVACGDVIKSQIQVDEKGKIMSARFKTWLWFCSCLQLVSHPVGKGKRRGSLNQQIHGAAKESLAFLARLHCSLLAEAAVQAALADDAGKQEPKKAGTEKKGALGVRSSRPGCISSLLPFPGQ